MNNNKAYDTTYYQIKTDGSATEENRKGLSRMQEEVFVYILKNWVVSGRAIRLYWSLDLNEMYEIMQPLIDKELVRKVMTEKQVKEMMVSDPNEIILTPAEERTVKIQELHVEIQSLADEYSRKRGELNRIFEKQEKTRLQLRELTKENYEFYRGGV